MDGASEKTSTTPHKDLDFLVKLGISLPNGTAVGFGQGENHNGYVVSDESRLRAATTSDGSHWTDLDPEITGVAITLTPKDALYDYANDKMYVVGQRSGYAYSYVSDDLGNTWATLDNGMATLVPSTSGTGLIGLAQNSSGDVYSAGYIAESPSGLGGTIYSGVVMKLPFGQTEWEVILHKREPYSGYFLSDVAIRESGTAEQIIAVGYGGPDCNGSVTVWSGWCTFQSLDDGISWNFIDDWTTTGTASKAVKTFIDPNTNDVFVVGTYQITTLKIRKSTDGTNFSEVYSGTSTALGASASSIITVDNAFVLSDGTIYVLGTFSLEGTYFYEGFALKSSNAGTTWTVDNLQLLRGMEPCPNAQIELPSGPLLAIQTCEQPQDRKGNALAPYQDFPSF